MENSFEARDQDAEHAPSTPTPVAHYEDPQIVDEDPEILACWIAAHQIDGVEARILELRLLSQDTRTEDLRSAIDDAIETCEVHRVELVEFLAEGGSATTGRRTDDPRNGR
jgi:hypothetical protein